LEADGEVVLGVANFPALDECYFASRGGGAWLNGEPIRASEIQTVSEALLYFNSLEACVRKPYAAGVLPFLNQFWAVRCLGGPQDAMMVVSGRAELWVEQSGKVWDLAPLKILAEEAGAVFFNFDGGCRADGGNCIIANRYLAPAARRFLGLAP
jgi:fructose-1,6-bisphosphatase/inositol monophosphatase family enzyme